MNDKQIRQYDMNSEKLEYWKKQIKNISAWNIPNYS